MHMQVDANMTGGMFRINSDFSILSKSVGYELDVSDLYGKQIFSENRK